MRTLSTIILFICFTLTAFGTEQITDKIVYKGDTLSFSWYTYPLDSYPNRELINPRSLFECRIGSCCTCCWRGYIAIWEIIDGKLYLTKIKNYCYLSYMRDVAAYNNVGIRIDSIGSEFADLKALFPGRYENGKVFADWFTGSIAIPQGKSLFYVPTQYQSAYERELEFYFEKGILKWTKLCDNSKSKQSIYSQDREKLAKFIYNNIKWDTLPKQDSCRVTLRFSANEEGIIDDVEVLRGYKEIYDKEAIRVIKSIPEWDVYFSRGKLVRIYWSIPIDFREKTRLKYKE